MAAANNNNALQFYRRRPGLNPDTALTWYSSWLQLEVSAVNYKAMLRFIADVMAMDTSSWICFARVPGEGWRRATEQATHQQDLMDTLIVNQWSSGVGVLRFEFEVQGRFVPLLSRLVTRHILRCTKASADDDVRFSLSYYIHDYPQWSEVAGSPPPPPLPEPQPEPVKWGA